MYSVKGSHGVKRMSKRKKVKKDRSPTEAEFRDWVERSLKKGRHKPIPEEGIAALENARAALQEALAQIGDAYSILVPAKKKRGK